MLLHAEQHQRAQSHARIPVRACPPLPIRRLAHCSAGKWAPEYSWQQTEMSYCISGFPHPACFCPDDDWRDMVIIPDVGKALKLAAQGTPTAGVVTGVTRMLYGSIPTAWGSKPDGSPAAWAATLTSM
jgi:hypothetical protein